jgi:hypothetical protein
MIFELPVVTAANYLICMLENIHLDFVPGNPTSQGVIHTKKEKL